MIERCNLSNRIHKILLKSAVVAISAQYAYPTYVIDYTGTGIIFRIHTNFRKETLHSSINYELLLL